MKNILEQKLYNIQLELFRANMIQKDLANKEDTESRRDYVQITKIIEQLQSDKICCERDLDSLYHASFSPYK